jgi:LPXTG-motif cell wall-anchored protein
MELRLCMRRTTLVLAALAAIAIVGVSMGGASASPSAATTLSQSCGTSVSTVAPVTTVSGHSVTTVAPGTTVVPSGPTTTVAPGNPTTTVVQVLDPGIPTDPDYPPTGATFESHLRVTAVSLTPGTSTGTIVLSGAVADAEYAGTLYSAAVALPASRANTSGVLRFNDLTVPAGFELRAIHHIDVVRSCGLVASFDECITSDGHLGELATCTRAPGSPSHRSGSLPRTGWDHLFDVLRVAGLALGIGLFLVYLRRRAEPPTTRA